jgi:hypothetical protein
MNDEAKRKFLVTMLVLIHELAAVGLAIRANVYSNIRLERLFSLAGDAVLRWTTISGA